MNPYVLPSLAAAVATLAAVSIARTQPDRQPQDPVRPPPRASFEAAVAATGIVEPRSEAASIGSPRPGIVREVVARPGQTVAAGDVLFRLEDAPQRAEVAVRRTQLAAAETRVTTASTVLEDLEDQQVRSERLQSGGVTTEEESTRKSFAVRAARARLAEARAEAAAARAALEAAETELAQYTVKAPVAGTVLQLKVRPGEAVTAGPAPTPLLLLGDLTELHVRADIDEHETARVKPGAAASGHLRGRPESPLKLTFVRFEPLVVPKRSLTGDLSERVDTRVLQAIYRIENPGTEVFPGLQLDVFIAADGLGTPMAGSLAKGS